MWATSREVAHPIEVIIVLYNDPKSFREDMLKDYVAAYPEYVEVPGVWPARRGGGF